MKIFYDVGVEPALQPVEGGPLQFSTANRDDGAHLDVVARDFWGQNRQCVFWCPGVWPFCTLLLSFPIVQMLSIAWVSGIWWACWRGWESLLFTIGVCCSYVLVAWDPLLQQFLGSLLLSWPKSATFLTADVYLGSDVGFATHCYDPQYVFEGSSFIL